MRVWRVEGKVSRGEIEPAMMATPDRSASWSEEETILPAVLRSWEARAADMERVVAMARKEKVKLMKLKMTRFGPMAASSSVLAYCPTQTASTKLMMGSARGIERAGIENLRMRTISSTRHCRRLLRCWMRA